MIDATVLIDAERGRLDFPAFLTSISEEGVALASITASELLYGCVRARGKKVRARRLAFVEGVLETIPVVPFTLREARRHAEVWAELSARGEPIGPHDLLLAATALANGFSIATLNVGEFGRVPGLALVPLERFREA